MEILTPKAAAALLSIEHGTLAAWRCRGIGPPYLKFGGTVRYYKSDIEAYIAQSRHVPSVLANMEKHHGL